MAADAYSLGVDRWAAVSYPGPHMPARLALALTPSDTEDLTNPAGDDAPCYAQGLFIGGAGNVAVVMAGDNSNGGAGTAVTFNSVAAGTVLPIQVRRVMSTNTTATDIVGLFNQ
jgi:hypothetical protein